MTPAEYSIMHNIFLVMEEALKVKKEEGGKEKDEKRRKAVLGIITDSWNCKRREGGFDCDKTIIKNDEALYGLFDDRLERLSKHPAIELFEGHYDQLLEEYQQAYGSDYFNESALVDEIISNAGMLGSIFRETIKAALVLKEKIDRFGYGLDDEGQPVRVIEGRNIDFGEGIDEAVYKAKMVPQELVEIAAISLMCFENVERNLKYKAFPETVLDVLEDPILAEWEGDVIEKLKQKIKENTRFADLRHVALVEAFEVTFSDDDDFVQSSSYQDTFLVRFLEDDRCRIILKYERYEPPLFLEVKSPSTDRILEALGIETPFDQYDLDVATRFLNWSYRENIIDFKDYAQRLQASKGGR